MSLHDKRSKLAFIKKHIGEYELSRDGNDATVVCPACDTNKRKLVIQLNDDRVHCWVCGLHGFFARDVLKKHVPGSIKEYQELFGDGKLKESYDNSEQRNEGLLTKIKELGESVSSGFNIKKHRRW